MASADDRIVEIQQRYGLSYHVPYAFEAERLVGLAGKKVLEVGGSLPEGFVRDELKVAQWVAIEEPSYWHELEDGGGTVPSDSLERMLENVKAYSDLRDYTVLAGGIEELPPSMENSFDLVFSIAAFEHILVLPLALERMYAALRPGGHLFTMFSPIWSAHDGHHLPKMTDLSGRTFDCGQSPIPPWGHLLMRPPQLMQHLLAHTDLQTATRMVYYTCHSQHISRLFAEDYVQYINSSPFVAEQLISTFQSEIPDNVQQALETLYPGRTLFAGNGLLALLHKPA